MRLAAFCTNRKHIFGDDNDDDDENDEDVNEDDIGEKHRATTCQLYGRKETRTLTLTMTL